MVDLGLGGRIIGRTNFEENGPDGFLPGHKTVYDAVPEISDDIELPQKEVLIAQQPDFVIAVSYSDFDAAKGSATLAELDAADAPAYITADWCDPEGVRKATIDDIFTDIRNLGMIFGVPERATELAAEYQAIIDDVEQRVEGEDQVAVLATDGGVGPVNAFGGSGLLDQMIEIAGGRNVLAELVVLLVQWRLLNALLAGEEIATSLGVNVTRFRGGLFVLTSLLVGSDHRRVLPVTALAGAAFLLLVDIAARTLDEPQELPLSIVTALFGGPFFLWLLRRRSTDAPANAA